MLNKSLRKCPYEDWEKSAISACSPSENFHCLQDEYDHIGWICTEPIWVEKGRCPVYNSGAKKLDSVFCKTDNCPSENYRSNYAYIKKGCRLNTQKIEDKNKINNTVTTDTGVNKTVPIEYLAIIGVAFLLLLAVIIILVIFIRKR
ncbi:uncharacterized protein LOC134255091, partial [Saccostrea cucullata]|uniref:uncharacterized protein LOC134255091 n=1 Tax=Saccostrea cuccullata TaxID=36930 RepID=UPI002ED48850